MDFWKLINNSSVEETFTGTIKDLRRVENNEKPFKRWCNSLIKGVPFTLGKERYVFVIKENSTGKGIRAIVYGKQVGDKLSEGDICYLTGTTDANGVIIGKRIYDPRLNMQVDADRVYSSVVTRLTSALCVLAAVYFVYMLSRIRFSPYGAGTRQMGGVLPIVVLLALSAVCIKNRNRMIKRLGWLLLFVAIYSLYPPIVIIVLVFIVIKHLFR